MDSILRDCDAERISIVGVIVVDEQNPPVIKPNRVDCRIGIGQICYLRFAPSIGPHIERRALHASIPPPGTEKSENAVSIQSHKRGMAVLLARNVRKESFANFSVGDFESYPAAVLPQSGVRQRQKDVVRTKLHRFAAWKVSQLSCQPM